MTAPVVPVTGYASVADYELRTGTDVPLEDEPTVQIWLNDVSALIDLYLGECAADVAAMYPDVLTSLVCNRVWRMASTPAGIRSESIGSTSVSYDNEASGALVPMEVTLLDTLMENACGTQRTYGVGQIGVNLGGPDTEDRWAADVDLWVLAGRYRR